MSLPENITVLFLVLFVVNVTKTVRGQCNGVVEGLSGMNGTLQSPNFKVEGGQYGTELGKASNCSWYFNMPMDRYLVLQVVDLALHFADADDGGKTKCMPSYRLKINGERIGCAPPRVTRASDRSFCLIYKSHHCGSTASCVKITAEERVEISYVADGSPAPFGSSTDLAGFRIQYSWSDCEETDSTTGKTSTSTETTRPSNEHSSTVVYYTTEECSSENKPVTVASSPDNTEEILYWKNWTIALAVFFNIAVCIIIYCAVKEHLPPGSPCPRRGRRDRYIVNEAFQAEAGNEEAQPDTEADPQADTQADTEADTQSDTQGDAQGDTQRDTQGDTQAEVLADATAAEIGP